MKSYLRILVGNFIFFLFLLKICIGSTHAQIIITELMPNPELGNEWIEITNIGENELDITGWYLSDLLSSPSKLYAFETLLLAAGQSLVVDLPTNKLNNSGDGVELYDQNGTLIDSTSYENSPINLTWSLIKLHDKTWSFATPTRNFFDVQIATQAATILPSTVLPSPQTSEMDSSSLTTPTPHPLPSESPEENHIQPTKQNTKIIMTQIVACPAQGNESVMLFNQQETAINLSGWHIADAAGNSRPVTGTINASSELEISWAGSMLNNTGDTLTLIDTNYNSVFTATYDVCNDNQPLYFIDSVWQHQKKSVSKNEEALPSTDITERNEIIPEQTPSLETTVLGATSFGLESYELPPINHPHLTATAEGKIVEHYQQQLPKKIYFSGILGGMHFIFGGTLRYWLYEKKFSKKRTAISFFIR